jgi:carbamate kinase
MAAPARMPDRPSASSLLRPLTLVAFGGNALLQPEDEGETEEQRRRAEEAASWLLDLVRLGHDLVVVHGNGPQVGQVLIQMEEGATKVPPGSLDVAVAQTEGSMGYLLELALRNGLRAAGLEREVATVLSLVVVDGDDPGFARPTKPVGPFFPRFRAQALQRDHGWQMIEDAGRGWRKVVPSPRPLRVLGVPLVRELVARGHVVIAGGGGGIPVVAGPDGELRGVEAVIDKDHTASLLGRELRADLLVILTGVPRVAKNFGKKNERPLPVLRLREARRLLAQGQFPPGSMGPKIEAAVDFVAATGRRVLITDVEHLRDALEGHAGTLIVADATARAGARPHTAPASSGAA